MLYELTDEDKKIIYELLNVEYIDTKELVKITPDPLDKEVLEKYIKMVENLIVKFDE